MLRKSLTLLFAGALAHGSVCQTLTAYEYWFDQNDGNRTTVPVSGNPITISGASIDASALNSGPHWIHFRLKDAQAQWSSVVSRPFQVLPQGSNTLVRYEYWFDEDDGARQSVAVTGPSIDLPNESVDASALDIGPHWLHFRIQDAFGFWGRVESRQFHRGQDSPYLITALRYWVSNDVQPLDLHTVVFDPPVQQLNFNSLLEACDLPLGNNQQLKLQLRDNHAQWSSVVTRVINVSAPAPLGTPLAVTALAPLCPGSSVALVLMPPSSGATPTGYAWSLLPGTNWSLDSTRADTAWVTVGSGGADVQVNATNLCGTGPVLVETLNAIPPPGQPGPITGDLTVCEGTMGALYSVPNDPTLDYTWTVTGGWTDSGSGNPFNTDVGTADATISVVATNQCGDDSPVAMAMITVEEAPDAGLDGVLETCSDDLPSDLLAVLTNPDLGGGWSGPSSVVNGLYDPQAMEPGVYIYTVAGGGTCPDDIAQATVVEPDLELGWIDSTATTQQGVTDTFTVSFLPDASYYEWLLPNQWAFSVSDSDPLDQSAILVASNIVSLPTDADTIQVVAHSNAPMCSGDTLSLVVVVDLNVGGILEVEFIPLQLWPNPTDHWIHVAVREGMKSDESLVCLDALGRSVEARMSPSTQIATLDVSGLANGVYQLHLKGPRRQGSARFIVEH